MRPDFKLSLPTGQATEDLLLDLAIPSRPEALGLARDHLDMALAPLGLDEAVRDRIGLATHEAMVNAMIHGNRQDPALAVGLRVLRDGGDLVIRIADRGPGFDPAGVPDPLLPENLLRPSGRGLLLMRALTDDLGHEAGGSIATLRWRLDRHQAQRHPNIASGS